MSLYEAIRTLGVEREAERLFIQTRWPDGIRCPKSKSDKARAKPSRKPQPFRCYACRFDFSVKTGTVIHGSKLPLSQWAIAAFLMTVNLKGVSSLKLHRDIGITQKTAWHLSHRIREGMRQNGLTFKGPVEVDEAYFGAKYKNMPKH